MMFRLLALGCLTAGQPAQDLQEIQGEWQGVELEESGRKVPDDAVKQYHLTIRGDEIIALLDRGVGKTAFKLDPTKSPKQIDLTPQYEPNKGKTLPGIYFLEKDELRMCCPISYSEINTRPTEVKSKAGDRLSFVVLKRVKPQ